MSFAAARFIRRRAIVRLDSRLLCGTHAADFALYRAELQARSFSQSTAEREKKKFTLREHGQVWKGALSEYLGSFRPAKEETSDAALQPILDDDTKQQLKTNVDFLGQYVLFGHVNNNYVD